MDGWMDYLDVGDGRQSFLRIGVLCVQREQ